MHPVPFTPWREWALWRAPKPVLVLVVGVYVAALVCVFPLSAEPDVTRFLALVGIGVACTMACLRMERARKFLEAGSAPNLAGTWTFAAALSLGHLAALGVVVAIYGVQWSSQKQVYIGRPHRYLFGAATVLIGVRVADLVHEPVLAGLTLMGVNTVLIAGVLVASRNLRGLRRLADVRAQGVEVATLGLGWAASSLLDWHLAAGVAVVPVLVGVQYMTLSRSIRQPTTIDAETGALTIRAWHALGALQLSQVREAIVIQANPTNPAVVSWAEFATSVRAAVRPEDLIGRGPDGFIVLVAGCGDAVLADMLALQVRARLAGGNIAAYTGFAVTPDRGRPINLQGLAVTAGADAILASSASRL